MLKRFLAYYKPLMGLFIADTVCAVVVAGVDLAFPVILRSLTGGLFTEGAAAILSALPALAAGLIAMYLVRCGCRYFVSAQGHIMGARMESQMRQDLFDQYERMGFAYFDSHSSGDMMSRVVNDLFDICEAAHHVPEWIIICAIEIIGSFVILFGLSPALASAILVVTLVFAAVMFRMNLTMRATFTDNRKKIGGVNAQLQDSLEGIRVVKSFANEDTEIFSMEMKNNFIRLDHFFNHDLHTHILQDFLEKFPCFGSRFFGCKIFFLICCFICRRSSYGILCAISRMIYF